MTEQEKIKEEIARDFLFDVWKEAKSTTEDSWDDIQWDSLSEKEKGEYFKTAKRLLLYLHSQRGAIKVEKELPLPVVGDKYNDDYVSGYAEAYIDMLKAGFVVTEPLIEEK